MPGNDLFLTIHNVSVFLRQQLLFENLNWEINENENWAIVGPNGSGKTTLAKIILKQIPIREGEIIYHFLKNYENNDINKYINLGKYASLVSFYDQPILNYSSHYYQQRFHSTESEGIIKVRDFLGSHLILDSAYASNLLEIFQLAPFLEKEIIKLSNGQVRKLQLLKHLLHKPRLLILDKPFNGLDINSRWELESLLYQLTNEGLKLILICDAAFLPDFITNVIEIENFKIKTFSSPEVFQKNYSEMFRINPKY